ncbi:MAG: ABC transporter permease [Leadbetterella sp.]|nr:ABC transporter permease [Leadbetterella sp.]
MIKNYFKIAWRNLVRDKGFSVLNILGLAVGIVCAALIFLWINYNLQTNKAFTDADNLYIIKNNQQYGNDVMTFSSTSGPLAPAISREIPGFRKVARTLDLGGVFGTGDKFITRSGLYADSSFFDIFSYPVIKQAADYSLANPTHIAISAKMAQAFFGDENPIGQTLRFNKNDLFTVKKIYDFPDENITLKPEFVVSLNKGFQDSTFVKSWSYWGQCGMRTYASLDDNASAEHINARLKPFIKEKSGQKVSHEVFLYPVLRLNVYNRFKNGVEQPGEGNIRYIRIFSTVGLIILMIACINFMNLATARSERRAKEIGLKKVVGASRGQIIGQFMLESITTAFMALIIAVLSLYLLVPAFGRMLEMPLEFSLFRRENLLGLLAIGLFCGILAGSYPSLYLSSFNPLNAIKKKFQRTDGASLIRKGLVVAQFSSAIVLIIAIVVIYSQINHVRKRELGYNLDNVVSIGISDKLVGNFDALKQTLISDGTASAVAMSTSSILGIYSNGGGFSWPGKDDSQNPLISFIGVDADFLPLLGVKMAEGRNFHSDSQKEGNNILINDAFAKLMGKEGRAGKKLYRGDENYNIVGITRPFLFNDLYGSDEPVIFYPMSRQDIAGWGGSIYVKMNGNKLNNLETGIKKIDSGYPFDYSYLSDQYEAMFKGTRFVGNLAMLFGVLAVFISCLGLFGLSAYTAASRKKEIGVRKVLGASVSRISVLLTQSFLKLVAVSFVIAAPLAWYLMNGWLKDFEYRIRIEWWIFALAGLVSMVIAILTVSFQAIKAALANPVKSLRTE